MTVVSNILRNYFRVNFAKFIIKMFIGWLIVSFYCHINVVITGIEDVVINGNIQR